MVDGKKAVLLCGRGQAGVYGGGSGAGMAEQALEMEKTQAVFKQMGGEGVAQRVDGDLFLSRTRSARPS